MFIKTDLTSSEHNKASCMQTSLSQFHGNAQHLQECVAILRVGGEMTERRGTPLLFHTYQKSPWGG